MLKLTSKEKSYSVSLPTSLNEITPEILNSLMDGIEIPKFHAAIAICFHVKLMTLAIKNNNKDQSVNVVSLLAKANQEDLDKIGCGAVGQKLILDRSTIERGIHLHVPIAITGKAISNYIHSDNELVKSLVKGGDGSTTPLTLDVVTDSAKAKQARIESKSPEVLLVEFKIIPVSGIYGAMSVDHKTTDPFKTSNALVN